MKIRPVTNHLDCELASHSRWSVTALDEDCVWPRIVNLAITLF